MAEEFKLEINVVPEADGFNASSPQIEGMNCWGPSIEYAVLEYCFALHLYTETLVEKDQTFAR
jgi:hypothetical protein